MQTKQTIALIGATEKMGPELAEHLAKGPHRLLLMDKNPEKLHHLQATLQQANRHAEVDVAECPREACWEADIIMTTVPYSEEKDFAGKIKEVATGKIVISVSGILQEADNNSFFNAPEASAAAALQQLLPDSRVIKTITPVLKPDTSLAQQASPVKYGDFLLAGKDEDALETVIELFQNAGLNLVIGKSAKVPA